MEQGHTIREAAALTGVGAHTLRYYERIGLLPPIGRAANGQRRYADRDLGWVRFLALLRSSGMSIQQMLTYVQLERAGDAGAGARCDLLEQHREVLRARIAELEGHLRVIEAKAAFYRGVAGREPAPAGAADP